MVKDFSTKALREIRLWTWAAAVLPITALAGVFFIWAFGTKTLFDLTLTVGATAMFAIAAIWWWWILWLVSRIIQKDRQVAEDLKNTSKEITELKQVVKETFDKSDK